MSAFLSKVNEKQGAPLNTIQPLRLHKIDNCRVSTNFEPLRQKQHFMEKEKTLIRYLHQCKKREKITANAPSHFYFPIIDT